MELIVRPATIKTQNKIYQDISYAASANSTIRKLAVKHVTLKCHSPVPNVAGITRVSLTQMGWELQVNSQETQ